MTLLYFIFKLIYKFVYPDVTPGLAVLDFRANIQICIECRKDDLIWYEPDYVYCNVCKHGCWEDIEWVESLE